MILLSLGSNLSSKFGNRFQNIDLAINYLESYDVNLIKKSSYFETPSYPDKSNPKFINVVIEVSTNLPPVDLASVLIFIEEKLGRKRNLKNEPRTCDIDIIDYKGQNLDFRYQSNSYTVPHKKLAERNFVLIPLKEIIPNWKYPKTNELIDMLIKKLPQEDKNSILKVNKD